MEPQGEKSPFSVVAEIRWMPSPMREPRYWSLRHPIRTAVPPGILFSTSGYLLRARPAWVYDVGGGALNDEAAMVPPWGVNVIHGAYEAVFRCFICVSSPTSESKMTRLCRIRHAGKHIYKRGSEAGKRVQCNMGAKNHGVLMPDANKANSLNQLVGAAFGAAGQRCMALSTAVFVGETKNWICDLKQRAQQLTVSAGPVISPQAKQRICELIQSAVEEGATLLLDGRDIVVKGYEKGNFVGPTILTDVKVISLR
ncbi:hypothetical protein LSTR_LSTR016084 [Laodelphax striatellus]|uniref:Probable methylmalonate-semialdehyde/malonate-semialdehyde dehydrogenase [acylating], mitochondrial n=1 Tax=Laodelphax striatellus TaxID=195883 RepID=A0A482WJD6_LAOST|nr:hypothetical protein LSTR_LSTR016084 [Laodelphax striatellus]